MKNFDEDKIIKKTDSVIITNNLEDNITETTNSIIEINQDTSNEVKEEFIKTPQDMIKIISSDPSLKEEKLIINNMDNSKNEPEVTEIHQEEVNEIKLENKQEDVKDKEELKADENKKESEKPKRQYKKKKEDKNTISNDEITPEIKNEILKPKKTIEIEKAKEDQMPIFNVEKINGNVIIESKKTPQFNYNSGGYRNNSQVDRSMTKEQLKILKINVNKQINEISLDISILNNLINGGSGDIAFYQNKLNYLKNELVFLYQKRSYIEQLIRN